MPDSDDLTIEVKKLGDFFQDASSLDKNSFAHSKARAFLLHHGPLGKLNLPDQVSGTMSTEGSGTTPDRPFNPRDDFLVFEVRAKDPGGEEKLYWVGRSEDNDITIPDSSVSAIHAFIKQEGEDFFVQDMNSMNGTVVNDEKVPPQGMGEAAALRSGSRVTFGGVNLTFLLAAEFQALVTRLGS